MQPSTTNSLDLLYFALFFPGFVVWWCLICLAIAHVGGWRKLAKKYRTDRLVDGQLLRFVSMQIGYFPTMGSYRQVIFVSLSPEGLGLSLFLPFRCGHPPLLIPWSAITECKREKQFFWDVTALYLQDPATRLFFYRKKSEDIYSYALANKPV
jgi:hypothetical protein